MSKKHSKSDGYPNLHLSHGVNSKTTLHGKESRSILFIGNYRPTIPLIHEFNDLGFRIIVGVTNAPERGYSSSRFVSERWAHSNPDDEPERFIDELNHLITKRDDITYVMPVAEDMLVLIQAHLSNLVRPEAYAMVSFDLVDLCLDKARLLQFAEQAGIKQSPFTIVTDYPSLLSESEQIGFPVVVRPTHSSFKLDSRKALVCKSIDQLKLSLAEWPKEHKNLIVQKLFLGQRHNLYFAAKKGKIFRLLETVADRTDHADGTGLAVMGRTIKLSPPLRKDTEMLLSSMNYTGIGCAQFLMCSNSDTYSFLEINPRIAGNHMLPTKAGLSLGPMLLALSQHFDIPEINTKKVIVDEPGLTYVWTYGDLGGCFREWKNGRIGTGDALKWIGIALKDAFRADMHLTWSLQDPMPALSGFAEKAFIFLKRFFVYGHSRKPSSQN